jgi:hypothetical protein
VTLLTMLDSVERAAAAGSSQRSWSTTAVKHEKFLTRVHEEFPTSSSAYSLNLAKFSEEFPTRSSTRISTRSSKREVHTSSTIAGLKMINALNLEHDGRDEAKALWEATKSGVASGSGSGAGVASGAMPGAGVASVLLGPEPVSRTSTLTTSWRRSSVLCPEPVSRVVLGPEPVSR